MSQAPVSANVRKVSDKASVIDIGGEITAASENTLTDAYAQASSGGVDAVVLNFAGLEYMNSSGIGLLVMLLIRANRQGQKILAVGLSEHYQHIFELTRLNEAIRIFPDESAAIAAADQ